MEINNKDYKRYKRMAVVICSGDEDEAADLLQDTLINFLEKDTAQEKLTDSFIFISLKNRFFNSKRGAKNNIEYEDYQNLSILESDEEMEARIYKEKLDEDKLNLIKRNIGKLTYYEQQLFNLIIIRDIKQITISRGTGMSPELINTQFKKIKEKLKKENNGK